MKDEALKYYGEMGKIAGTITGDPVLRDDLRQEGAISLLEAEAGQERSWYLQRSKRAMLNYLNRGVSVDSKRREDIEMTAMHNKEGEEIGIAHNSETARERMIYLELKEKIEKLLTREELRIVELKERGLNNTDIARVFNITKQSMGERIKRLQKTLTFALQFLL